MDHFKRDISRHDLPASYSFRREELGAIREEVASRPKRWRKQMGNKQIKRIDLEDEFSLRALRAEKAALSSK